MSTVTLYIPCYNSARFLSKLIRAVMNQRYPIAEVLIVDDGSTDETIEIAKAHLISPRYPLRIIRQPFNGGLARARNTAVNAAKTEFVASLDSDCIPDGNWLKALMDNFRDPSVSGAGGKLIEAAIFNAADRWRAAHMRQHWGDVRVINPLFLYGHGTVFRTSRIREVGCYDERHRTNGEDVQISLALLRRGHKLVYDPTAVAMHLKTDTTKSVLDTKFRYGLRKFEKTRCRFAKRLMWHWVNAGHRLVKDVFHRRWSIMPLSVLYPFWMMYREVNHECRNRRTQ